MGNESDTEISSSKAEIKKNTKETLIEEVSKISEVKNFLENPDISPVKKLLLFDMAIKQYEKLKGKGILDRFKFDITKADDQIESQKLVEKVLKIPAVQEFLKTSNINSINKLLVLNTIIQLYQKVTGKGLLERLDIDPSKNIVE